MSHKVSATAFAPATIGNVSVGFDVLGMAISGVGDHVTVEKRKDKQVLIQSISGLNLPIPQDAQANTAGAALLALQQGEKLNFGFNVNIEKGIPLGSGMGGSAASAVAAVVAASGLVQRKISMEKQFRYALEGEKIASGAAHPDNVAPCLWGGLTLASLKWEESVLKIPVPKHLSWVLIHPEVKVETKQARGILAKTVPIDKWVEQSANLASFIAGFYKKDLRLIQVGFTDLIIEPQRAHLIPGFALIKELALRAKGTIGFSISGSGPSVFALTQTLVQAKSLSAKIEAEFAKQGIHSQSYWGTGPARGARLIPQRRS